MEDKQPTTTTSNKETDGGGCRRYARSSHVIKREGKRERDRERDRDKYTNNAKEMQATPVRGIWEGIVVGRQLRTRRFKNLL